MVAKGDLWEGHELLSEERGMVRTFRARQVGDTGKLVSLHIHEGARIQPDAFAAEIRRLQDITRQIPEILPVCYGGIVGDVAWAASPVLSDAIPLIDAMRGHDIGPTVLQAVIDIGQCLARAHELDFIHGALSPDRVFVSGDGRYAITHFGFIRLFRLGAEDVGHDPYGYVPPELISGGRLGRRTDVYGFGTIMYQLLCKRPLSAWTWPPSFPIGTPPVLQCLLKRALAENPKRRQPSIAKMLAVMTPFARAWAELGGPPEPRPSESPEGVVPQRDDVTHAPPVAALRPSESPDTLKSVIPPRDDVTHAPSVAPRSPAAPALPDLDPILIEPILPVPPARSTHPRPSGTPGRRSPVRLISAVLTLAFLLGSSAAVLLRREQSPRTASPHMARGVRAAALRVSTTLPPRPSDAPQAPPPVAPRSATDRQATLRRQGVKTPPTDTDICYGLVSCGKKNY